MYVYMWHEPRLNAIKIGYGNDAKGRMLEYAKTYGLQYDEDSLVMVEIPTGFDCSVIETTCHNHATDSLRLRSITNRGAMQELFLLGSETYEDVSNELHHVIERKLYAIVQAYEEQDRPTPARPVSTSTSPVRAPELKPGYRWKFNTIGCEQEPIPGSARTPKPGYRWKFNSIGDEQEPIEE
jgi:hypothetical protein